MSSQRRSGAADAVSMAYSSHSAAAPSATAAAIIAAVPPVPRAPPGRLIDAPVSGSVAVITFSLAIRVSSVSSTQLQPLRRKFSTQRFD